MQINDNETLWVEKYRPQCLDDIIMPKETKAILKGFVEKGDIPNLIFHSANAGTAKTTTALALAKELGYDTMFINASLENGIDVLRNKITNFASTISFGGKMKVVILDEADGLSQTFQPALRGFIETFSQNVRFIFTCNYVNKLLPPIVSRCTSIHFDVPVKEKAELMKESVKRCADILKMENIEYDPKSLIALLKTHYPDMRRVLNELQRYSASGRIDTGVLVNTDKDNFSELSKLLKARNFSAMRQWVGNNRDTDPQRIFRYFYDHANDIFVSNSIPQLILTTAEYQYKSGFVADQEINTTAYLTEVMANCEYL